MSFQQGAVLLHGSAAATMAYGYKSLGSLTIDAWVSAQKVSKYVNISRDPNDEPVFSSTCKGGHFQFLTIQGCV
jgi:hypothetical protein